MDKESTSTRKRAVGTEAVRLERRILRAIVAAGDDGMLQMELVAKLKLGEKVVRRLLKTLRAPGAKRIYVARWQLVSANYCGVFKLGDLPDADKPGPKTQRAYRYRDGAVNAEALAKKDIAEAHQRWADNWVPHCDPAAAWIGRAAA
ncbi:hypothetical protein CNECB9_2370151 [Cupriavidus necator]|uniref:Uncharacterized protein n=1 Tax=Cupriavidus necator TaxID=106590 RepID=A0A1K0JC98_CUPNE|nr:hypothetical protein CNECB9_2370151 [Cupriavidus necator]